MVFLSVLSHQFNPIFKKPFNIELSINRLLLKRSSPIPGPTGSNMFLKHCMYSYHCINIVWEIKYPPTSSMLNSPTLLGTFQNRCRAQLPNITNHYLIYLSFGIQCDINGLSLSHKDVKNVFCNLYHFEPYEFTWKG